MAWLKNWRLKRLQQKLARYEAKLLAEECFSARTGRLFPVVLSDLAGNIAETREKIRQLKA